MEDELWYNEYVERSLAIVVALMERREMEESTQLTVLPDPLDQYPTFDSLSLKALKINGTFRENYGRELYQRTRQTSCAYCGFSFANDINHWLYMSVDHVIPTNIAKSLSIPKDYYDSIINLVLCCRVCNDFKNKENPLQGLACQRQLVWSFEEFLNLRRAAFSQRQQQVLEGRRQALQIYQSHWTN